MKGLDFTTMTVDEMWRLYEDIGERLSVRLTSEKRELEKRLAHLQREKSLNKKASVAPVAGRERRKYPRVMPKYENPAEPHETWSGRGKQPRWLVAALKSGHAIEEFAIGGGQKSKSDSKRGARAASH
jgi:DNA-binding protein H-NS